MTVRHMTFRGLVLFSWRRAGSSAQFKLNIVGPSVVTCTTRGFNLSLSHLDSLKFDCLWTVEDRWTATGKAPKVKKKKLKGEVRLGKFIVRQTLSYGARNLLSTACRVNSIVTVHYLRSDRHLCT